MEIGKKNEEKFLTTLRAMNKKSLEFINEKRLIIGNNWQYYRSSGESEGVKGSLCFTVLNSLMALDATDSVSVRFSPKDGKPSSDDRATFLTRNLENDYYVGNYRQAKKLALFEKYFTGVGVMAFTRWNQWRHYPELSHIPTLACRFDPKGGTDIQKHRWFGYAYSMSTLNLDDTYRKEVIKSLQESPPKLSPERQDDERVELNAANLQQDNEPILTDDEKIRASLSSLPVCDFFVVYPDKKGKQRMWKVTVDQSVSVIIRLEPVEPTTREEGADPSQIPYPVVLDHFSGNIDRDVFGVSLFDILKDKEKGLSTILNLSKNLLEKNLTGTLIARQGTLAENLAYTPDTVVEVGNNGGNINEQVMVAPVNRIDLSAVIELQREIRGLAENATSVNESVLGISSEARTLGEARLLQNNSNVRHRERIADTLHAYVTMAKLSYKEYRRHFTGDEQQQRKTISILTGAVPMVFDITADDFSEEYPEVIAESLILTAQEDAMKSRVLKEVMPFLTDPVARREALREILRTSGVIYEHTIDILTPPSSIIEPLIEAENRLLADPDSDPLELTYDADILARVPTQMNIPTRAGIQRREDLIERGIELGLDIRQNINPVDNLTVTEKMTDKPSNTGEEVVSARA